MQLSKAFISLVVFIATTSAVPLVNDQLMQAIIENIQAWEKVCNTADGGAQCGAIAARATDGLTGSAFCKQQEASNAMTNFAQILENQEMMTAAQLATQSAKKLLENLSNNVSHNILVTENDCQHASQNSQSNSHTQGTTTSHSSSRSSDSSYPSTVEVSNSHTLTSESSTSGFTISKETGPGPVSTPHATSSDGDLDHLSSTALAPSPSSFTSLSKETGSGPVSIPRATSTNGDLDHPSSTAQVTLPSSFTSASKETGSGSISVPHATASDSVASGSLTSQVVSLPVPSLTPIVSSSLETDHNHVSIAHSTSDVTHTSSSTPGATQNVLPASSVFGNASQNILPGPVSVSVPHATSSNLANSTLSRSPSVSHTIASPSPSTPVFNSSKDSGVGPVSVPHAPSPTHGSSDDDFRLSNAKNAQRENAQFAHLTPDSACTKGEQACVDGGVAECFDGKFAIIRCPGETKCFALPLANTPGTAIACTTESNAASLISKTGATGGIDGSSEKKSDN